MSHPCRSKPKMCPGPRSARLFFNSQNPGSAEVKSPGKAATDSTNRISADEIQNRGRRRRLRHASAHRLVAGASASNVSISSSSVLSSSAKKCSWPRREEKLELRISNPWVQCRVQQVNEQVSKNVNHDQEGGKRNHGRSLTANDRVVKGPAHSVDIKNSLGDDCSTHEGTEVRTQEGDHGNERIA